MITESDDQAAPGELVAVLSDGYWRRQFGGDPAVIGQTIELQSRSFTIVGVAPRNFTGLEPGTAAEIIIPLNSWSAVMPGLPLASMPDAGWLRLLGRRKPNVSIERVQADISVRGARLAQDSKAKAAARWFEVKPAGAGLDELRNQFSLHYGFLWVPSLWSC